MNNFKNDTLGFEQFKIDEQLSSIMSQILGGYARLAFKAEKHEKLRTYAIEIKNRFQEVGKIKLEIKHYSYPEKLAEIQKFQLELKNLLDKEKDF